MSAADGRDPQNIATTITEVSERASLLVREEIELAKAEFAEKTGKLVRGAIVGTAAGIFIVTALLFVLIGFAWLIYYLLPVNVWAYFFGFFAMAAILVVLGVIAGLVAARLVKRGAPPTPEMAIEEGRKMREAIASPPPSYAPPAATGYATAAPAHEPAAGRVPPADGQGGS